MPKPFLIPALVLGVACFTSPSLAAPSPSEADATAKLEAVLGSVKAPG